MYFPPKTSQQFIDMISFGFITVYKIRLKQTLFLFEIFR